MFKFSIRDLLWLTVVVALGVGWWLDRKALVASFDTKLHMGRINGWRDAEEYHFKRIGDLRQMAKELQAMKNRQSNSSAAGQMYSPQGAPPGRPLGDDY